jgi:hypothetical protein
MDIHIGDSFEKALSRLEESGFKQKERYYFKKGYIYIILYTEYNIVKKIQVGFIDRALIGREY